MENNQKFKEKKPQESMSANANVKLIGNLFIF